MDVVVDTSTVAGIVTSRSPTAPATLVVRWMIEGSLGYVVSHELLQEYHDVLLRPKLARAGLSYEDVLGILGRVTKNGAWLDVPQGVGHGAPPGDDHVAALLLAARESSKEEPLLISSDRRLRAWVVDRGTGKAMSPREFVDAVAARRPPPPKRRRRAR